MPVKNTNFVACISILCFFFLVQGTVGEADTREGSATFVTALYDIGRDSWPRFSRSFSVYLERFKDLLTLDINLVVFGEQDLQPFVKKHRRGKRLSSKSRFVKKPFSRLPAFKHKLRMDCIFELEAFREDNEKLGHPEAFSSDYLVVIHSKAALLGEVIKQNPFNTTHFFWIDASYAATAVNDNDTDPDAITVNIPAGVQWSPTPLLSIHDKVTYVQIKDPQYYVHVLEQLHKRRIGPALAGGFFGGAVKIMLYFVKLYNKQLLFELTEGEIGHDQTTALQLYFQHPRLFHLVPGDWFDAYRLFH